MRLLRAELTRFFARRFTRLMLLALVLALGVIGAVVASQTHQLTDADIQRARADAADVRASCEQYVDRKTDDPKAEIPKCGTIRTESFLPYVLDFREEAPELLLLFAGLVTLFGYLVGASFIGAEWSSGGMTNLLLWRSQRQRVLFGKLTALSIGMLLTGVLLGAAWIAAIWTIARFRGTFGDLTPSFWTSLALDGARGTGLALIVALTGAALASLGRRTAAALGVLIGYLVVWEIGARTVMYGLNVVPEPFVLSTYVIAFLEKDHRVYLDQYECFDGLCHYLHLTWYWGLAALGGVALLTVLAAAISFRRRDAA